MEFDGDRQKQAAIAKAKEFVRANSYTMEDVKIVSDGENIMVVTKREVGFKKDSLNVLFDTNPNAG